MALLKIAYRFKRLIPAAKTSSQLLLAGCRRCAVLLCNIRCVTNSRPVDDRYPTPFVHRISSDTLDQEFIQFSRIAQPL